MSIYDERLAGLDEYQRFLLDALLKQAAQDAGKPLSTHGRKKIVDAFFEEHLQGKKEQATAKRKATMSRKMRDIREQAKTDFQWQPPVRRR